MKSRSLINTFQLLLGFMIFIGFDQTNAQTKPAMSIRAAPGDGVTLRIIRTPSTMLAGQPFNVRWETTNATLVSFSCTSPSGGFAGSATLESVNGTAGGTADLSWLGRDSNCVWTAEGDTELVNVHETMRTVAAPNNAQFQSQNVPTQMVPGQTYPITIVFRNNSTASWTEAGAYRLGTQNPQDNATWGINRVPTESVAPDGFKTFTFNVTAPSTPGTYNFQWRMVQEGVQWFGDYTPNVAINVAAVSSPAQLSLTNCSSNSPSTAPNAAVLTCTLSNVGQSATNSISYANSALNGMTVDGPMGYCVAGAVCGTVRVTSNTTAGNYSGTLIASPTAAGGINASTSVNLQVHVGIAPPTISVVRSAPIKADQSFTTAWSTNGDSLSYSCTANGGGFNGGGYVSVNGSENRIAQVAWVGNPSTCRWIAVGAGGVTEYVDYIVTEAPDVPVLNLSIISPSAPPNTSTQATVAIGQPFTLRWNLTGVANATLGCHDGFVSYDRAPIPLQGERTFIARPEWAIGRDIGCSVMGNKANGDLVFSDMVYITVPTALLVSINPNPLTVNANVAGNATGNIAAIPSGGTAPYSYSWTRISGTRSQVSNSTIANPIFNANINISDNFTETWRVFVSDAGGQSTNVNVNINFVFSGTIPKPIIEITRSPSTIYAGTSYTTTWKTNDATSLSYVCTAPGTGFNGSASVSPLNGVSAPNIAPAAFVGYPSTCTWTALGVGGTTTYSEQFVVDNTAPTASFNSPVNGANYPVAIGAKANILINGQGADIDGTISKLELLVNGVVKSTINSNSIDTSLQFDVGNHSLQLRVTDNFGLVGLSNIVNVSVTSFTGAIDFTSIAPSSSGGVVTAGGTLSVGVDALVRSAEMGDAVNRIELRQGTNVLATRTYPIVMDGSGERPVNTTRTFNGVRTDLGVGVHQLYLRAYTTQGGEGDSASYSFTITDLANIKPIASFQFPNADLNLSAPVGGVVNVNVIGTGVDSDGNVVKLELIKNNVVIYTSLENSINYSIQLSQGSYSLFIRATDNSGAISVSEVRNVKVTDQDESLPIVVMSSPSSDQILHVPANWPTAGITVAGEVTNVAGAVVRLEVLDNDLVVHSVSFPSISIDLGLTHGIHKIQLRAVDSLGRVGLSNVRTISVNVPAPTINIHRTPSPIYAGVPYTTSWETTNATSISYSCTADGTGYQGTGNVTPLNGSAQPYIAPASFVGYPSTCIWTATGPGGVSTFTDIFEVKESIFIPTIKVERSPNPLVAGKEFTTTWKTEYATSVTYSCTANGRGFKGAGTLAPNGDSSGTALAAWVGNPSTCIWTAIGEAGTQQITETMVTKPKPLPTIDVVRVPTVLTAGKPFKTTWTTTDATEVRYSCTAENSGFNGSATLNRNGNVSGIALVGWVNNPSTCIWTATGPGGEVNISEVMITDIGALPTIKVTRNPTMPIAGKNFSTKWVTTDATSVQYSCTALGSGFNGTAVLASQGTSTATASADWVDYPSACIWTATGPNGTTSITETLDTGAGVLPTIKVKRTPNPLVAGQPFTTTWSSTKATSITYRCQAEGNGMKSSGTLAISGSEDQTAQFDWVNSPSLCTWTATGPGGEREIKEPVTTINGSLMSVVLDSNVKHIRAPQGQTAPISFTGYGNFPTGKVRKLDLFLDDGNGYAATPIKTITGNNIKLMFAYTANLSLGSYRLKLRATDQTGSTVDSTPLVVNVIDSPLLGEVSGIRSNNTGKLELFGWACQDNNSQGLNYAVYADAPSRLGGTQIASGTANLATENNQTQVSELCHTPNAGHHFVVSLSPFAIAYGGKRLFVEVATDNNALKATLPCADNNCTMPGAIRIGLTTPQNNDRYTGPAIVFMRAKIDNGNGIYDELAFNINGEWISATPDNEPGTYSAMKVGVPSRDTPYPVMVKVRQGNTTVYSSENLIYVDAINNGVSLTITKPANNQTVNQGKVVDLSAYANILQGSTAQIYSVKFYINNVFVANGVNAGNGNWNAQWTPAQIGVATLRAKAFDQGGAVLQTSSANQLVISDATGTVTGDLLPVNINLLDLINKPDAGSLPGSLSVTPNGAASYSIPLDVPPGTAGVQPKISLDYSSQAQNSRVGLGWSLGGFSSIHRCGKTIAQDGVNGRIGFDLDDRLCLDGQRLVLVSGDTTNNVAYWADGAEFRTELESFTKIVATGAIGDAARAYEVRSKDGRISTYGGNNTSTVKAVLGAPKSGVNPPSLSFKNGAQSWALNTITDRSGNYIRYAYEQDGVTGEHRPKFIRYGGNGLASHAAVELMYEGRQDAWTRYIDETRNDLRLRLTQVKTYVGNNLDGSVGSAGTWVRETNLSYEYSPTSGRSLLQSVESCGRNPSNSAKECLPKTTFNWGKPDAAKTPGFVSRGPWAGAPRLVTVGPSQLGGDLANNNASYFAFSDFENRGLTDVLEKRVASPVYNPRDLNDPGNILPQGTLRSSYRYFHNKGDGTGFSEYRYQLNTGENFAVLSVGDFDGNGILDLIVSTASAGSKICMSPLGSGALGAPGSTLTFTCDPTRAVSGANTAKGIPYVIDVVGEGRSAHYGLVTHNVSTDTYSIKYCAQGTCVDSPNPSPVVFNVRDPNDGPLQIPLHDYVSIDQSIDFTGTGKQEDLRFTRPRYIDCYPEGGDANVCPRMWLNLQPEIITTGFNLPNVPLKSSLATYRYPTYAEPCKSNGCAPYGFEAPIPGANLYADFNGSGYSGLFFGYFGRQFIANDPTKPNEKIFQFKDPEATLCLSTGRALDCNIRRKISGSNYPSIRAVGNFVGSGQPTILIQDYNYSANLPPQATGDLKMCRLTGDDVSNGTSTNDDRLICETWTGLKLPSPQDPRFATDQVYLMDLLGTGRMQIVYYHSGRYLNDGTYQHDGKWELFEPIDLAKSGEALDRIVSVTNGLNATSTVEYVDGISTNVVTKSANSNLSYPLRLSPSLGKIASRLTHSNGISGTRRTSFRYEDAAMDVSGRGSLGFAKFIATDENTGIKNTTSFKQGWPLTGMVDTYRSETTGSGAVTLVNTINQWKSKSIPQNSGSTTFVYLEQSDTQLRDVKNYDLGRTETVSRYIDDFGNLNSQTVKVIGNNQTLTTDTNNSYRNDKTCWAIGLPLTTSVTKSDSLYAGSITRRIDRDFDTCKLLPLWEAVEKGNAALELTTTFERTGNPFGLVNRKTETWFDPDPATSGTKSRTSSISYDAKGRYVDTVTNALNHQESHVYDEGTGARTRLTGPNGLSTNWRINAFGRTTVELRADGNETRSYIKDCRGGCPLGASIVQISDQFYGANRTSVPQLAYSDNAGHVLRTQTWGFDGNIIVTDHAFDQLGRPENTYHPRFENAQAFKVSTLQYDLVDRVIESTNYDTNGEARRTTTSYDGYNTTMVNPRSQTRVETHNVAKQLVQVQDANNGFTKFSYDPFGNLTQTIDPENNVIVVDYDTLGRKKALNDPDLGVITYKVNPLGQTWAQISPKQRAAGQQTRFVFDKLGRMTGRIETDLESHWIFDTAPNGKGQLAEAYTGAENAAPSKRTYRREHTYDEKGRPKKTTQSLRDASYTNEVGYDTWGRALTLSYTRSNGPSKSFYHRYNNMGYLAKIERAGLILWQVMQQDASHRVTLASLGNGLTQNRAYNPYTARLDTASLNNGVGEARVQEGYQYDSLGNVEHRQQYWSGAADGFQEQYTYDSLNRLETTTMNNDTNARQVFTYDKTGNIKRKPNVSSGEYVYPPQGEGSVRPHAVSAIPGVGSFSYDANGNLENGAGRSITWKSFDMPFSITKGSQYSEFTYGPEHQRTYQTRNDGSTTEYAGAQEVETKDGILTIKTYWPGGLGVEIDKGNEATKLLWMHQDRLGSQIAITDETGTLKEKLAFDAWGKRLNLNGVGTPDNLDGVVDNKGYTGHEMLDQLDLVHMNGRVYDPLVARFVSADPILQDPMNGQSYNRFAYVFNNPTNLTDPTGFCGKGKEEVTGTSICQDIKVVAEGADGKPGVYKQKDTKIVRTTSSGTEAVDPKSGGAGQLLANNRSAYQVTTNSSGEQSVYAANGGASEGFFSKVGRKLKEAWDTVTGGFYQGQNGASSPYDDPYSHEYRSLLNGGEDSLGIDRKLLFKPYATAMGRTIDEGFQLYTKAILMTDTGGGLAKLPTAGEKFFAGATLHERVVTQMLKNDAHSWPVAIDKIAVKSGRVFTTVDSRGKSVQMLELKGTRNGVQGTYEYIKNSANEIYHHYFNAAKP